jgi:Fur family transcriptional regulator, ferric uptake regulator
LPYFVLFLRKWHRHLAPSRRSVALLPVSQGLGGQVVGFFRLVCIVLAIQITQFMPTSSASLEEVKKIFTAYIENKGLRKTPERFAILEEIYQRNDHFDVEELYISMKNKKYQVSRATVYNTLDVLVECDLVLRHQFGGNEARYEKAYGRKQHDHLICTDCHRVTEFCDPRIQNIQSMVGEMLEFKVLHHSLIFYGSCIKTHCEYRPETPL